MINKKNEIKIMQSLARIEEQFRQMNGLTATTAFKVSRLEKIVYVGIGILFSFKGIELFMN